MIHGTLAMCSNGTRQALDHLESAMVLIYYLSVYRPVCMIGQLKKCNIINSNIAS